MSRESIIQAIKENQPDYVDLPVIENINRDATDLVDRFITALHVIGGSAQVVSGLDEVKTILTAQCNENERIISTFAELSSIAEIATNNTDPHAFADIDLAIIEAHFGVAENGAVWVTESLLPNRVLPFICQQLAVIVKKENLVGNMHEAYSRLEEASYGFGTFIAGPSKTADIEQSLVLGAHGPKTMQVFIVE